MTLPIYLNKIKKNQNQAKAHPEKEILFSDHLYVSGATEEEAPFPSCSIQYLFVVITLFYESLII